MKRTLIVGLLVVFASAAALAHSKLGTSVPANGAVLARMPAEIVLTFSKRLRLTRVRMVRDGGPTVALEAAKAFGTRFAIPVKNGGEGAYRIEWRGLAADGHAMRGAFSFRVK